MKQFLIRRWFLLALGLVMVVGFCGSSLLLPLASHAGLRYGVVATVLFLMALPLEARAMWRTASRPAAPVLAILVNYGLLPLFAWLIGLCAAGWLLSADLIDGMMVAAATPCTLASASVWTRRAGGNDAVSIMVTVITNATCFLVTPFWLWRTTGHVATIGASQMIVKLALVVVLPMTVAQLLRIARPVGHWATRRRTALGVVAQTGILTMVLFGSIQTGHRFEAQSAAPILGELVGLVVCVVGIHLAMFVVGFLLAGRLKIARADQIAVGFAGSQKTLMVGLQVAMELGFNIIPMVAYHVSQLLVDTLIADRLRNKSDT